MCRKFNYCGFLVVVVAVVTVGLTNVSQADMFLMSQVTGDADSGISSSYAYTCAVDLNNCDGQHSSGAGATRTVNGVTLTPTYFSSNPTLPISGTNWSLTLGSGNPWHCELSSTYDSSIMGAINDFYYSSNSGSLILTLSGLTPGSEYVASFFNYNWSGPNVRLNTTTGGSYDYNVATYGTGSSLVVTDTYTAPEDGSVTFTFAKNTTGTPHLAAFTNYLVPEPSALALLATGLIGLLCYAWRKRKSKFSGQWPVAGGQ